MNTTEHFSNVTSSFSNSLPNYDYVSWALGILAVLLAISFFFIQERRNKKIESFTKVVSEYNLHHKTIEDSIKFDSLLAIHNHINISKQNLISILRELEKNTSIEKLEDLIDEVGFGKVLLLNADDILKHNNNIKFLVISSLYFEIELIGGRVKALSDLDQMGIRKIPEGHELWKALANTTIREINDLDPKITDKSGLPTG